MGDSFFAFYGSLIPLFLLPASSSHTLPCAQDVSDEDAVFFANMETACALSQDGAPVIGESVAVFGAGTVGALTAAVLAHHGYPVTVFDPRADRLAALQRRFPKISCGTGADFDVCIEASGSQDALASALQRCRRGGTVVIGAWMLMKPASFAVPVPAVRLQTQDHCMESRRWVCRWVFASTARRFP